MTYEEAQAYIASLVPRGWRLGLDRMQEFLRTAALEDAVGGKFPPSFIHVTGTNGKGSVTAFLQSLLIEQGYRTGAFFSPFVYDPRERVQIGRELISREDLARITEALMGPADNLASTPFGGATEFEFKTALGFKFWKEQRCEWVALEVGLGGRLDATNVVTPGASVIVSIGLDHTSILGADISEIAAEKAGIIKPHVPVVVGQLPKSALDVVERTAEEHGAPIWRYGVEVRLEPDTQGYKVITPTRPYPSLNPGIEGEMQPHNMALAVAALDAADAVRDPDCISSGVARARIPGRFERRTYGNVELILDGAHNPDAAKVLRANLERYFPGRDIVLVAGMVSGHDPAHFFEPLAELIRKAFVVPIKFHRGVPASDLSTVARSFIADVAVEESVEAGLRQAMRAADSGAIVLITGSFYLVGEAGAALADRVPS